MKKIVAIRGGGDLASGVALRLHRAGFSMIMLEREDPLTVRRHVAFGQAVFDGKTKVAEVNASKVASMDEALQAISKGTIPVMVEPRDAFLDNLKAQVIVDGRMLKSRVPSLLAKTKLLIGIGPGFSVGQNCHAVIESQRGHDLGRVLWQGSAAADSGVPGSIANQNVDRVLRSSADGRLKSDKKIGDSVQRGETIAKVGESGIIAPFDGVLRGLIHEHVALKSGMKIGDLDPRNDVSYVNSVSDKALAIGGGVLEAILSKPELRELIQQ
jgi:xanthine dehydrogenase accessory factor